VSVTVGTSTDAAAVHGGSAGRPTLGGQSAGTADAGVAVDRHHEWPQEIEELTWMASRLCTDRELAMSEVGDDQMNPSDHIARGE
jgi:hypothetical protein